MPARCGLKLGALISGSLIFLAQMAHAASFKIYEASTAQLGTAYSGTGVTHDPSVVFWNPAGMSQFDHPTGSLGLIYIHPDLSYRTEIATGYNGMPITGSESAPGRDAYVPHLYFVQPFGTNWFFGFGVSAPYGLKSVYEDESTARYFATRSSLRVVNIGPTLAFRVSNTLTIAGGIDIQRLNAELNSKYDIQSISPGLLSNDITIINKANSWGYGWNAGILYGITKNLTVGLHYRSKVTHHIRGDSRVRDLSTNPIINETLAGALGLRDSDVAADIDLPETVILSVVHNVTHNWKLKFDAQWIRWSRIKALVLRFSGNPGNLNPAFPTLPDATTTLNYCDTFRFALGQRIQLNHEWAMRMGVAFDQSPTSGSFRTARIPDNDRYWLAFGFHYQWSQRLSGDIAYAHIFFEDPEVTQSLTTAVGTARFIANYEGSADLIGIQMTYRFA